MQPVGDARTLMPPAGGMQAPMIAAGYPGAFAQPVVAAAPVCAPGQMAMTGMAHIAQLAEVHVQEKANLLQEVTAMLGAEIEMANKYKVFDTHGNQVFYAVEQTDCCRRQLQNGCCHDCAPYDVQVLYTPPGQLQQNFVKMTRPCQFTCCCVNRPVADVVDQSTNAKIGSFRDPCTCCCLKFQVRDAMDADVLEVDGGCCITQPGLWCPLPCGPCSKVEFDVKDAAGGHRVARIEKQVPSCLTWCFAPDVDNYHVTFEQVQNPQWKAILLAFTIFLDFRYFNVNRNEQNAQRIENS